MLLLTQENGPLNDDELNAEVVMEITKICKFKGPTKISPKICNFLLISFKYPANFSFAP